MFFVSDIYTTAPSDFKTVLQEKTYRAMQNLNIPFERVDTDEAITMEAGNKSFKSKKFSNALGVARVSFAPAELMEKILGAKIGAATVFSAMLDKDKTVQVVFDKDVISEEWYGCSDGTTTSYMKIKTAQIIHDFLPFAKHIPSIIEV